MYYDRTLSNDFASNLEPGGKLRWLFEFVKNNDDLDFLIGRNVQKEWISVYRGLTRIFSINSTLNTHKTNIDGATKYKQISPNLYASREVEEICQNDLRIILEYLREDKKDRNYNNKKEGFYQNAFSRTYGIAGTSEAELVIVDKEAVIGYKDLKEKENKFINAHQKGFKNLQSLISIKDPERYGSDLFSKSLGNELDFIALNKNGDILLIEFKHGTNTSGIYLSPLQIGLYYDIFAGFEGDLKGTIESMFEQKQKIGLIPEKWEFSGFSGKILPILVVSEFSRKSAGRQRFHEIMEICRNEKGPNFLAEIEMYNYLPKTGLTKID